MADPLAGSWPGADSPHPGGGAGRDPGRRRSARRAAHGRLRDGLAGLERGADDVARRAYSLPVSAGAHPFARDAARGGAPGHPLSASARSTAVAAGIGPRRGTVGRDCRPAHPRGSPALPTRTGADRHWPSVEAVIGRAAPGGASIAQAGAANGRTSEEAVLTAGGPKPDDPAVSPTGGSSASSVTRGVAGRTPTDRRPAGGNPGGRCSTTAPAARRVAAGGGPRDPHTGQHRRPGRSQPGAPAVGPGMRGERSRNKRGSLTAPALGMTALA